MIMNRVEYNSSSFKDIFVAKYMVTIFLEVAKLINYIYAHTLFTENSSLLPTYQKFHI